MGLKAMVLTRPGPAEQKPLEMVELADPKPGKGEVLVKVSVCGVCHTDLDEIEGRLRPSRLPIVPGHQVVGTVTERGKAAERFAGGERVGITWLYSSCGKCEYCRAGLENLCTKAKWTGKDVHGGYAEYMVVGEDYAYPLDERFNDAQAAPLLCAGVIGYRALRLTELGDGQRIGLFGFGASAHIVIQVVRHRFPNSKVYVFTRSKAHKQLARKLGAAWVGSAGQAPPAGVDKAIDFTPVGEAVRDALGVLRPGGRLVINAIRKETPLPEMEYDKYLWDEREVKSTANVTRRDAEEFLPLASEIPIRPEVAEYELAQANEVVGLVKAGKIRAAAVLRMPKSD